MVNLRAGILKKDTMNKKNASVMMKKHQAPKMEIGNR
jgi:hypothetical protein